MNTWRSIYQIMHLLYSMGNVVTSVRQKSHLGNYGHQTEGLQLWEKLLQGNNITCSLQARQY